MRAVVQRVKQCSVTIEGNLYSSIENGLLIFLGVKQGDSEADAKYVAEKCANLRIFNDENGKMNLSLLQTGSSAMVVSQFTLYGDTRRGNRPSYTDAADPQRAESLYNLFVRYLRELIGEGKVATGIFRAMMDVELLNDGPVTLIIDSK
ncbi:MAG: D-tyrosyl-tRNA(Tyr) deacylase [Bacteroidetes bacterium]|jgi:D-tyrosyl-tRNA(Tyr) deacylase|nr:D-tyrosyl-tRNA(Tyr) deacylase [Bacteroidota bacterium]HOV99413.1 D-aminoacyl-tRNA deacylase [Bacteroidota bacterium]